MRVWVACATTALQELVTLELPDGATLADALSAARSQRPDFPPVSEASPVGVWGQVAHRGQPLRDGDRVEVYRPISADAKALRRDRARLSPSPRRKNAS